MALLEQLNKHVSAQHTNSYNGGMFLKIALYKVEAFFCGVPKIQSHF